MKTLVGFSVWIGLASLAAAQAPTVENCPVLPADNIWNTRVDQLPVSPSSSTWVNTIGATSGVHPDFGAGLWNGAPIGIPFVTVPGGQTNFVRIATVGANVKTYTNPVSKGTYLYRVQAFNATTVSAYSNTVSVRVVK